MWRGGEGRGKELVRQTAEGQHRSRGGGSVLGGEGERVVRR